MKKLSGVITTFVIIVISAVACQPPFNSFLMSVVSVPIWALLIVGAFIIKWLLESRRE